MRQPQHHLNRQKSKLSWTLYSKLDAVLSQEPYLVHISCDFPLGKLRFSNCGALYKMASIGSDSFPSWPDPIHSTGTSIVVCHNPDGGTACYNTPSRSAVISSFFTAKEWKAGVMHVLYPARHNALDAVYVLMFPPSRSAKRSSTASPLPPACHHQPQSSKAAHC